MYTIVKCEGCTRIFAVSREQPYLICPTCGCSFRRDACTSYLDCEYRTVALEIAARLDELIKDRTVPELTPEEMGMLQRDYQEFHQKFLENNKTDKSNADSLDDVGEKEKHEEVDIKEENKEEKENETESEDVKKGKMSSYSLFE